MPPFIDCRQPLPAGQRYTHTRYGQHKGEWYSFTKCHGCTLFVRVDGMRRIAEENPRSGRSRMKTHVRSPAGKERQTARRNARNRSHRKKGTKYRFQGAKLLHNVLDVGVVPNYFGRLQYHAKRYEKKGRTFVWPKHPKWGFRLLGSRNYNLPLLVVKSLERLYAHPVYTPVKRVLRPRSSSRRTPRNRSRSDTIAEIERLMEACPQDKEGTRRYNNLNDRLQGELALQGRAVNALGYQNLEPRESWFDRVLRRESKKNLGRQAPT